jgi:hypothetical protein
LLTEDVYLEYLKDQMSVKRILRFLELKRDLVWINYIAIPIMYLIKFSIITLWVLSGSILFGYKNSFQEIFRVVIIAEFFWLVPSFIMLIWFGCIDTGYTLQDIQYFKPLSLLNFFNVSEIESWLIFPLQSLNLFEVVYMFVLAIGIKRILKKDYLEALNFTIPVYGTALMTWIVFITFLNINLSA